jgi:hypothetical protein
MPKGVIFWVLMLLAFIFSGWGTWSGNQDHRYLWGGNILIMALLFLLGWQVFGFIVQ